MLTFQITRPKKKKILPSPAALGSSCKPRRKRQTDLADHQSQRDESTFTQPPGLIKSESGYRLGLLCQYARGYRAHLNCTVRNSTSNDSEVISTNAAIFSGSPKMTVLRLSCYTYMSVYLCVCVILQALTSRFRHAGLRCQWIQAFSPQTGLPRAEQDRTCTVIRDLPPDSSRISNDKLAM